MRPVNCPRVRPQNSGISSASHAALPSLSANNGTENAISHTAAGAYWIAAVRALIQM